METVTQRVGLIAESRLEGIMTALAGAEDLAGQANRYFPGLIPPDIIARIAGIYSEIDRIRRRPA